MKKLIILFISLLIISACQSEKSKVVTLTYMYWGDIEAIKIQKKIINLFQKANPNIKIEDNGLLYGQYHSKLLNLHAGGTSPDVAWVDGNMFPAYVRKGIYLDISDSIQKAVPSFDKNKFYAEFIRDCIHEGRLYGLPVAGAPYVMVYNKTEFDNAGVTYPDKNTDWSGLTSIFQKIVRKGPNGKSTFYGININLPSLDFGTPWFWANGGSFFNADLTKCVVNSKEVAEVLQMLKGYSDKGYMPNFGDTEERGIMMSSEKMAMFFDWRSSVPLLRTLKSEYAYAPFPKKLGSQKTLTMSKANAITISATTKYPDEAMKFLAFITSAEAERLFVRAGRFFPQQKENLKFFLSATPPLNPEVYDYSLQNSRPVPHLERYEEIRNSADDEIMNYFLNIQSVQQTLFNVEKAVNALLAE